MFLRVFLGFFFSKMSQKGQGEEGQLLSLKTVTSLNKEARVLKFCFILSDTSIWGQWTDMLQML